MLFAYYVLSLVDAKIWLYFAFGVPVFVFLVCNLLLAFSEENRIILCFRRAKRFARRFAKVDAQNEELFVKKCVARNTFRIKEGYSFFRKGEELNEVLRVESCLPQGEGRFRALAARIYDGFTLCVIITVTVINVVAGASLAYVLFSALAPLTVYIALKTTLYAVSYGYETGAKSALLKYRALLSRLF